MLRKTLGEITLNNLHLIILLAIIILNIGFSYKFFTATLYGDAYTGVESEINKIFSNERDFYNSSVVFKEVGDILKQQEGIENSYVMTTLVTYTYYANSKFIYTDFQSGTPIDSLQDFIEQKNWSEMERYYSQLFSYPRTKNLEQIIPDYVIYNVRKPIANDLIWYQKDHPTADVSILANPNSADFPKNFELIYHSDKTNTFVYKIHHEQ